MALTYQNLDAATRARMADEVKADLAAGKLYISPRLQNPNPQVWADLLVEAASAHDDGWLAAEIRVRGLLKTHEERKKPKGGTTIAQVPANANDTLAEGEFNRFYVRGLCRRAIDEKVPHVVAYRARHSDNPRPESVAVVGKAFSPEALLDDLRASPGVETSLGLPPGPNSGLSVKLP